MVLLRLDDVLDDGYGRATRVVVVVPITVG